MAGGFLAWRCDSVKISTPLVVTPTECSNCADSERSRVTAVQPSDRIFTCGLPRLIIGSIVENIPGFRDTSSPGPADVNDARLVVEHAPEAVAAEIAHHAHALRFDETLDGVPDIAGGGAGFHRGDAAHHGLVGYFDQPFGLAGDRAHRIHPAGIAVPALEDEGNVDVDDVAFLQQPVPGHAVADHVVDRSAGRIAVAAVHQGRGVGVMAER